MKLLLNTYPYRLEPSDDAAQPAPPERLAEILLAFRDTEDQDLLFSYINWDKELDPHRMEMIEESLQLFHRDFLYDPDQKVARQVKELLLAHFAPDRKPENNEALMDQLLDHFRSVELEELSGELNLKIGACVHDVQMAYTLDEQPPKTQAFIKERLVHTSGAWLLPYERPVYVKNTLWFRANTAEEILDSFAHTDSQFTCVIIGKDQPLEAHSYLLDYTEEEDDSEGGQSATVLTISTTTPEHFEQVIVPRLQQLFHESLTIIR